MLYFSQAAVNSMNNTAPGFSGFMNNFVPGNNQNMSTPQMNNNMPPPPPMKTQDARKSKRFEVPTNRPDISMARSSEGINVEQKFSSIKDSNQGIQLSRRPEMKGPSDISDILSGIKTKQINLHQQESDIKESSTISIQDLKELSSSKLPKSTKKGKKTSSEKNTISLDI